MWEVWCPMVLGTVPSDGRWQHSIRKVRKPALAILGLTTRGQKNTTVANLNLGKLLPI